MSLKLRPARLGGPLGLAALVALALLALPGTGFAKHGDDGGEHSNGRENAGTVASFDSGSGELTIDLAAGGTASALVTDATRIRCVGRKRGGHEGHHHRGRGRGHEGEDGASSDDSANEGRRGQGKRERRGRGRGHRCGAKALTDGATIRKARIETGDDADVFVKILVERAKGECGGDKDGAAGDDDGTPDQGPGDA